MNAITNVWRQMVRRRLWPLAIILVAALAAVPVLLAKEPDPAPPAPPVAAAPTDAESALAKEPIVTLASEPTQGDRSPLGKRHDIFKPTKKQPKPTKAKAADDTTDKGAAVEPKPEGDSGGSSGGTPDGGTSTPPAPAATPEPEPKTYPLYSLVTRFTSGEASGKGVLPRGSALPSRDEPLLIYLGLLDDHKTAVFMVDSTIRAIGDGRCDPTPENCETVRMRAGDTMFFDVVGADGAVTGQFQLDLLKINKKQTTDAAKAARSARLAKVSSVAQATSGLAGGDTLRRLGVVGRTG